ncbi:MAG TPA: hypothetical protein VL354_15915 [Spirochaetia bacterium]|nr:hypothetical protein [Spirochaetia bacterium]
MGSGSTRRLRRLGLCWATSLLVWGCAASQPQREVTEAFRAFLADVRSGDQEKILATAPFLSSLPAKQKEAALQSFERLASQDPDKLSLDVSPGPGQTYLLRVDTLVVPFVKDGQGHWEISPVVPAE